MSAVWRAGDKGWTRAGHWTLEMCIASIPTSTVASSYFYICYQVCCLNPWLVQVETATCQHDSCESEGRCRCVSVVTNVPVSPHQAHLPAHLQARDNDGAVTMFRAELCYRLHHSSTTPPCDCFYSLFSQPEIRSCIGSSRSASAVTTLGPDLEM